MSKHVARDLWRKRFACSIARMRTFSQAPRRTSIVWWQFKCKMGTGLQIPNFARTSKLIFRENPDFPLKKQRPFFCSHLYNLMRTFDCSAFARRQVTSLTRVLAWNCPAWNDLLTIRHQADVVNMLFFSSRSIWMTARPNFTIKVSDVFVKGLPPIPTWKKRKKYLVLSVRYSEVRPRVQSVTIHTEPLWYEEQIHCNMETHSIIHESFCEFQQSIFQAFAFAFFLSWVICKQVRCKFLTWHWNGKRFHWLSAIVFATARRPLRPPFDISLQECLKDKRLFLVFIINLTKLTCKCNWHRTWLESCRSRIGCSPWSTSWSGTWSVSSPEIRGARPSLRQSTPPSSPWISFFGVGHVCAFKTNKKINDLTKSKRVMHVWQEKNPPFYWRKICGTMDLLVESHEFKLQPPPAFENRTQLFF